VTISLLLALPVALGMTLAARRRPDLATADVYPIMRIFSMGFFVVFVAAFASTSRTSSTTSAWSRMAVFLHNAHRAGFGYGAAAAFRLPEYDRRAIAIEVGIQNSALALVADLRVLRRSRRHGARRRVVGHLAHHLRADDREVLGSASDPHDPRPPSDDRPSMTPTHRAGP
jgi:hypothetical protein